MSLLEALYLGSSLPQNQPDHWKGLQLTLCVVDFALLRICKGKKLFKV